MNGKAPKQHRYEVAAAPAAPARRGGFRVPYAWREEGRAFVPLMIALVFLLWAGLIFPAALVLRALFRAGLVAADPLPLPVWRLLGLASGAAAALLVAGRLGLQRVVFWLTMLLVVFFGSTFFLAMLFSAVAVAVLQVLLRPFGMEVAWEMVYLFCAAAWTGYGVYLWFGWITSPDRDSWEYGSRVGVARTASGRNLTAAAPLLGWAARDAGGPVESGWSDDSDGGCDSG